MKNIRLALWNFPPLCCGLLSVLLRTFFFELFCFFFFFDRKLVSVDALGHLLGSNPNWKGLMWRLMCRANWQSQRLRYFLRPTKLRWSRKENLKEGPKNAPRHRGWIYSQTRSTGTNGQLPCILDRQRRLPKSLRPSRSVRIGVVRFEKKFGRQPVRWTAAFSSQTVR